MRTILGTVFALLIICLAYCAWCVAAPPYSPQPGVLVLKNGRVLAGNILREGDRWLVTLGDDGNHLRIPAADVDFACRDLTEAYLQKRSLIRVRDVKPHLDLADWCLRNKLLDRAADEVVAALAIDPHDRRIADFERRLKFALPAPEKKPRPPQSLPLSQEEIAREVKTLSREAQEQFAATIQPLLLNRCATAGCHGPGSTSDYHLVRPPAKNQNILRETQRNLFATMKQINSQGNSPLLIVPQAPHGTSKSPIFDQQDERQIRQIAAWIELTKRPPELVESPPPRRDSLVKPAEYWEPLPQQPNAWPHNMQSRGPRRLPPNPFDAPVPVRGGRGSAPRRGGPANPSPQVDEEDPFSADAFNQRFHGAAEE